MYDVKGNHAMYYNWRVVLSKGIGKEFAKRLLQDGCKACISDVNVAKGLETKD